MIMINEVYLFSKPKVDHSGNLADRRPCLFYYNIEDKQ